jgi:hypothetical protein
MKRILAVFVSLLGLGIINAPGQDNESRYRAHEWDLSPFATYVDKAGGKWGVGTALTYFLSKQWGVGAATYWTDFNDGTFFKNLEAESYFRIAQFKSVAPYGTASIGYQFDHEYWFETIGGGVDFRAFKKLSAFSDVQYRFTDNSNNHNGVFIRMGVRFAF